jgi:uncharacterized membrane protein YgcG
MKASDMLRNNNGLKTTQSVLNKQQSGVDAVQKVAQTQAPVFTQQQLDAAGKKVDQMNAATPQNETPTMKAAREKTIATQQAIANGVDVNQGAPSDEEDKPSVPIVKKEESKPQPKQLSYADMYKMLNPEMNETAEQRANREKKERAKARIAATGDGLRALANIFFATNGAKVVHNPESDMTKAVNKRKAYMDAQREKNRASWLAGYQRALALDEEARKNNLTLAEQMRYHDMQNEINKVKNDQGQQRIDQGNRRLDLSELKYTNDAEYKDNQLKIKKMLADGQISHWAYQDALARLREGRIASKAQKSSGGNQTTAGYWYEYYDLMDTPEGQKKINELKRKLRIKNVTQTNVRYLMDRLKGRRSSTTGGTSTRGGTSSGGGKHTTHKAGGSSAGGKKKTGVNW